MKTQSKDMISWEKQLLFNENVVLKGQFINQKYLNYLCILTQRKTVNTLENLD